MLLITTQRLLIAVSFLLSFSPCEGSTTSSITALQTEDKNNLRVLAHNNNNGATTPSRELIVDAKTFFDTDDFATAMLYTDENGNTPFGGKLPPLAAGCWWMDGNIVSEIALGMASGDWKSVQEDGFRCRSEILTSIDGTATATCIGGFSVFLKKREWAWKPGVDAKILYWFVQLSGARLDLECGGDSEEIIDLCNIRLNFDNPFFSFPFKFLMDLVAFAFEWDFVRSTDDLYIRTTRSFNLPKTTTVYYLKRIINGDGSEGRYWDEFRSGGTAVPDLPEDARDTVSFVPEELFT